jgi:hypothetical protein
MTTNDITVEVIGSQQISHRAGERGPHIGRIDTVRTTVDGVSTISEVKFWYQWETGKLLYVR